MTKLSECCQEDIINSRCFGCDKVVIDDVCNACFGTKEVTENIGQKDEKTVACPECSKPAEIDPDEQRDNQEDR